MLIFAAGCQPEVNLARLQAPPDSQQNPERVSIALPVIMSLPESLSEAAVIPPVPGVGGKAAAELLATGTPTASAASISPPPPVQTAAQTLSPEAWKEWPVLPEISEEMRQVYLRGLAEGRNPAAFSILGDCQSQPEVFLGVFDSDPDVVDALPQPLRETVAQFQGSFNRYSPTVKDGTTEGALLWAEWNDNKEKKCNPGETPLDCELRVHQPSIVFIHVGTHWESRQMQYMRKIIERILEHGAVPVMVTKADNRELDEKINPNLVLNADEYHLPVWNFWRTVQHLPERGMEKGSNMYLSAEGLAVHQASGLEALNAVWRGLNQQ